MKPDTTPSLTGTRYGCRIPVRMTSEERRAIGQRATSLNLSISRYLVQLATQRVVRSPEEQARLRYLHALFRDTEVQLKKLLGLPAFGADEGVQSSLKAELQELASLVGALTQEIARRVA